MQGIFLIDKPSGITSAKAISHLKKRLNIPKIGHAGTLDPLATGLLVVMVGKATRLSDFIMGGDKRYTGVILFGCQTTTDDIEGGIINRSGAILKIEAIQTVSSKFVGTIDQRPPNISAIKIEGKRAYQITRSGEIPEISTRKVKVNSFDLINFNQNTNELRFNISCSCGTYIRSIARDLGQLLGSYGCIKELRRESSEPFNVTSAKEPEKTTIEDLQDWTVAFPKTEIIEVPNGIKQKLLDGKKYLLNEIKIDRGGNFILREADSKDCFALIRQEIDMDLKLIFLK